jgi:Family of unknown function (DUF6644)
LPNVARDEAVNERTRNGDTLSSLLAWIEATTPARSVAASVSLTAWLSAFHLIGFTILIGSALVAGLRAVGALLPQASLGDVLRPAHRMISLGLAISVTTGGLLFAARATEVAANGTFRLKMLLLVTAVAFQGLALGSVKVAHSERARAAGAISLALWLALALAACAFILLE